MLVQFDLLRLVQPLSNPSQCLRPHGCNFLRLCAHQCSTYGPWAFWAIKARLLSVMLFSLMKSCATFPFGYAKQQLEFHPSSHYPAVCIPWKNSQKIPNHTIMSEKVQSFQSTLRCFSAIFAWASTLSSFLPKRLRQNRKNKAVASA